MNIGPRDIEDFEFLRANGAEARARGLQHFEHLDQPVGVWNYVRIANEIAAEIPRGKLLDWGCGFGQMTYLLRRRGFEVTPFDVRAAGDTLPDMSLAEASRLCYRSTRPTCHSASESFDIVLSCGVLEHVDEYSSPGNELKSLGEIKRVLRPRAYFPIYQLPQRYSWTEALQRRLDLGYWHPRRFTSAEIRRMLSAHGYRVERVRRYNLLPRNLTALPNVLRSAYGRNGIAILAADRVLSRIPGVNQLAGVLEVLARRAA